MKTIWKTPGRYHELHFLPTKKTTSMLFSIFWFSEIIKFFLQCIKIFEKSNLCVQFWDFPEIFIFFYNFSGYANLQLRSWASIADWKLESVKSKTFEPKTPPSAKTEKLRRISKLQKKTIKMFLKSCFYDQKKYKKKMITKDTFKFMTKFSSFFFQNCRVFFWNFRVFFSKLSSFFSKFSSFFFSKFQLFFFENSVESLNYQYNY